MNINDEQFNNLNSASAVALRFAGILADIVKHKASRSDLELWDSVPEIGADAKWGDIVKDYSIRARYASQYKYVDGVYTRTVREVDPHGGQVGVVREVRDVRKRDGRMALVYEIVFFNHTVLRKDSARYRKIEIIIHDPKLEG
jgi:hypothetical protein